MAALSQERLGQLLDYCRIDQADEGDAALLASLYGAAVEYLRQAGVSTPEAGSGREALYDTAVNYLVLDGYDRREATITGTVVAENPAFRRVLNQLKMTEPEGET